MSAASSRRKSTSDELVYRYIKSVGKGILKVMSKMGISTYQSYCGAQIFDAVGLKTDFVAKYFTGTSSLIEGIGLDEVAGETTSRHRDAFNDNPVLRTTLDIGGEYMFRMRGEAHMWSPDTVAKLQHAVRTNSFETFTEYSKLMNRETARAQAIRGLFTIAMAEECGRAPVPLEEVQSAASIVRKFSTGAMSFGSISREAHTTLARAMNRIGGKSNTGEGGEEPDRYMPLPDGSTQSGALGDQAGRLGPVWRDGGISGQFRHDADQDGAGRKARRGRTIARPQGRCDDCQSAAFNAGRRPDLAAAAS